MFIVTFTFSTGETRYFGGDAYGWRPYRHEAKIYKTREGAERAMTRIDADPKKMRVVQVDGEGGAA